MSISIPVHTGFGIPEENMQGGTVMKRVKTLTGKKTYAGSMCKGGCGECQTSCQSACKTSCTVGNQTCENNK